MTLTVRTLLEAMEKIDPWLGVKGMPPSGSFDLYGHPTITEVYELDVSKTFPMLCTGRRVLIVPKSRLDAIYHDMKAAGLDVRLSPVMRSPELQSEPGDADNG